MQQFTIVELSVLLTALLGGLGGLVTILQHSKCTRIKCACIECVRSEGAILADATEPLEEGETGV